MHIPGSNGGALFGYTAAEPTSGNVYVIGQDNPGVLKLLPPEPERRPERFPGRRSTSVSARPATARTAPAPRTGRRCLTVPGRVDPATIRAIVTSGKGRMPAFPHLNDVDMENVVSYVSAPVPGGPRPRRGTRRRRSRPDRSWPRAVLSVRAATGRGRGGPRPYPEGVEQRPQYVIDAYGTIGVRMKPPFTSLTKYDLNTGTIKWQVGLGDDARLAALGITGTGVPQMRSSLIVHRKAGSSSRREGTARSGRTTRTPGRCCGRRPLGGAIRGGPSMYEMDGRQYLLVHASGDIPLAGRASGRPGPDRPACRLRRVRPAREIAVPAAACPGGAAPYADAPAPWP